MVAQGHRVYGLAIVSDHPAGVVRPLFFVFISGLFLTGFGTSSGRDGVERF
jgi:hypothetical protein